MRPPRDTTELLIHQAWCQYLGESHLSIDDDFFEIGGSSLAAVRVLDAVNHNLGSDLTLSDMFFASTVESMARQARSGQAGTSSALVTIRSGTAPAVLAFIHTIGGGIIWYRDLIHAIPDPVTCVGLQPVGLDPRHAPHDEVSEMAAHYLARLTEKFEPSDLVIIGYSFGGIVGFEMVRQMEATGSQPNGLLLLDAVLPSPHPRPAADGELWELIVDALDLDLDVEDLIGLPYEEARGQVLAAAASGGSLPPDYDSQRLQRLVDLYSINDAAARRYRPGPIRQPVHIVRPNHGDPAVRETAAWRQWCPGGINVHDADGDHSELISGKHAIRVAELVRRLWLGAR